MTPPSTSEPIASGEADLREPRSAPVGGDARPLRVGITVDPYLPVPPTLYGGIERVADFLVRGLAERGHEVVLFAHPGSRTPAKLVPYGSPPHRSRTDRLRELVQLGTSLVSRAHSLDLIHSFGRLAALAPCLPNRSLPKVQSYQRAGVPWRSVGIANRLAGTSIIFTACSTSVYAAGPSAARGNWRTIFNGVDIAKYNFAERVAADAPLVFLGRLERIKGAHNAIEIATGAGRRVVLAGNRVDTGPDRDYFETEIAPRIDGDRVRYIGPVDDAQKNELLGAAAALLMPIEWEEPFGIVMAEALACGTPVVGFARGSVPEVVREGVNGFSCTTVAEAVRAVQRLGEIDRAAVRRDCVERFGDQALVSQYEALYYEMVRRVNRRGPGSPR